MKKYSVYYILRFFWGTEDFTHSHSSVEMEARSEQEARLSAMAHITLKESLTSNIKAIEIQNIKEA